MPPGSDANPALSRAVGSSRHLRAWLVPGEAQVCLVERFRSSSAGAVSCHETGDPGIYSGRAPIVSVTIGPLRWRPHREIVTALLPDGTRGVRLMRAGRTVRRLRIRRNAIIARPGNADALRWRTPAGSVVSYRLG